MEPNNLKMHKMLLKYINTKSTQLNILVQLFNEKTKLKYINKKSTHPNILVQLFNEKTKLFWLVALNV